MHLAVISNSPFVLQANKEHFKENLEDYHKSLRALLLTNSITFPK